MKYSIFIAFLLVGICQAFLSNIGNTIGQVGGGVVDQVGSGVNGVIDSGKGQVDNLVGQVLNIANGIQFAAQFLWESLFSTAIDLFLAGGQLFPNNESGQMTNVPDQTLPMPDNPLADKYAQITARFKTNLHILYEQLFLIEQEAMKAISEGEVNFEGRIRAFYDQIAAIEKQMNEWAEEMKSELETFASTIAGDWQIIIDEYKQNIDITVLSIHSMFEKLSEHLMKNLLDFASTFVSNANNLIDNMKGQGLLSFLGKK